MSDHATRRRHALGYRLASYRSRLPSLESAACVATVVLVLGVLACRWLGVDAWWVIPAPGILGLMLALRRHPHFRRLELFQNGIDLAHGRRHRHVLWSQVYEVYQKPVFRLGWLRRESELCGWSYRLVQRDGRSVHLAGFDSLRGLGMRIQSQVARRQLPVAMDAFRAGYCVRFGRKLSLSSDGIHLGTQLIPWRDISEISIDEADLLQITCGGQQQPCAKIPCHQIPNLSVLDGILQATQNESQLIEGGASSGGLDVERDEFDEFGPRATLLDRDETQLLMDGYDWDDIHDLHAGQVSIDELLRRGPQHRPRRPR